MVNLMAMAQTCLVGQIGVGLLLKGTPAVYECVCGAY